MKLGVLRFALSVGVAAYCAGGTSWAQKAPSSVEPVRALGTASLLLGERFDPWADPELGPFAPQSAGDSDLGEQRILAPRGSYQPFGFLFTERAMWTDNAALTDGGEFSDFFSDTELRLNYLPQIGANTYAELSGGYSFYRYADHSRLDFDRLETSAGGVHVFRGLGDLSVWLRYNHTQLLTARDHAKLFTDHAVELVLHLPIAIGPRHFAYANYSSEFSLDGDPGYAARDEHGLTLGHHFLASDRISFGSHYRISVHDYTGQARTDVQHTAGLSVTARLTQRIDLSLSGNYTINESDQSGGDYRAGQLGAVLALEYEF